MTGMDDTGPENPDTREEEDLPASTLQLRLAASIIGRLIERNGGREVADQFWGDGVFDSLIVSHLIEHVADRSALAREIGRIAKPGAKVYIEWPRPESGRIISRDTLVQFGIQCSTLNFFDDSTHLELVSETEAEAAFTAAGFRRISAGEVINDYLYTELFRCGVAESDSEATTYALWLAFRFSRYLIMEKAGTTT